MLCISKMSKNHQFFKLNLQIFVKSELGAGLSNFCLCQLYICLYIPGLTSGGGAWVQNQRTAQQLVQYYFHGNFLKRATTITKGKKIGFI